MAAAGGGGGGGAAMLRTRKVDKIFRRFDANADGRLNRDEMAALVIAVNPRVKFSDEQIRAILDEVFRTYGEFIDGDRGLSYDGLLRTYDDGAGDVDRDFDALGLSLEGESDEDNEEDVGFNGQAAGAAAAAAAAQQKPVSIVDERAEARPSRQNVGAWAASPNNGIVYEETWRMVEDLEILLRRAESKLETRRIAKVAAKPSSSSAAAPKFRELGASEFRRLQKEVSELRQRADACRTQDEAFDAHMAMGRCLYEHSFLSEALISFKRATELRPADVRPHFRVGNTLYGLALPAEANEAYESALEAAAASATSMSSISNSNSSSRWSALLPQIHINLGVALEAQGLLLNACEHYREAAILNPAHYRALKLLGSALLGVGEYRAAEKALGEAVFLKPDYADAHCDLGSALRSLAAEERAAAEFQAAIDAEPRHADAMYNLAGLLRDSGRFQRAAELYSRVLQLQPTHWRAQLNHAVSLLGAGDAAEARASLKSAWRMSHRVELYDALEHLRHAPAGGGAAAGGFVAAEPARVSAAADGGATPAPRTLGQALAVRAIQRTARLQRLSATALLPSMQQQQQHGGDIRKAEVERWLHRLLRPPPRGGGGGSQVMDAEAFQVAVKVINERVLAALDRPASGKVDPAFLLACLAPLCAGGAEARKRAAFEALAWRRRLQRGGAAGGLGSQVAKVDAEAYFRYLRAAYLDAAGASVEFHGGQRAEQQQQQQYLSYPEFAVMFDDVEWGFGILGTLMVLESCDRARHAGMTCAACCYPIIGPRFKEVSRGGGFSICAACYSECNIPAAAFSKDLRYVFKEYHSASEPVKDRFRFFSPSSSASATAATA